MKKQTENLDLDRLSQEQRILNVRINRQMESRFPEGAQAYFFISDNQKIPSLGVIMGTYEFTVIIRCLKTPGQAVKRIPYNQITEVWQ